MSTPKRTDPPTLVPERSSEDGAANSHGAAVLGQRRAAEVAATSLPEGAVISMTDDDSEVRALMAAFRLADTARGARSTPTRMNPARSATPDSSRRQPPEQTRPDRAAIQARIAEDEQTLRESRALLPHTLVALR